MTKKTLVEGENVLRNTTRPGRPITFVTLVGQSAANYISLEVHVRLMDCITGQLKAEVMTS